MSIKTKNEAIKRKKYAFFASKSALFALKVSNKTKKIRFFASKSVFFALYVEVKMKNEDKDSIESGINIVDSACVNDRNSKYAPLDRDTVLLNALRCICGGSLERARELLGNN